MTLFGRWLLTAAFVLMLAGCGSAHLPVSSRVQSLIEKAHPGVAFVPTRLPAGYRYWKYNSGRSGFGIFFSKPRQGLPPAQLGYGTGFGACGTYGSAMHTFTMNGVPVQWSATYEDQQAWRCLTTTKRTLIIDASWSISGDDSLKTPKQLSDARDLTAVVAYSKRIG
jgi:hypothetical protein